MDPELEALLKALGCSTAAEAQALINQFNSFLTDVRVATGTSDMKGALAAVNANAAGMRQIEATTGKAGVEAIGVVTAWKALPEQLATASAELEALKLANAKADAKSLLDAACADEGRVSPAARGQLEDLYNKFGIEALKSALAALPPASATTPGQRPAAQPSESAKGAKSGAASDSEKQVMKATGKTLVEIREAQAEWDANETDTPTGRGVFITRTAKPTSAAA